MRSGCLHARFLSGDKFQASFFEAVHLLTMFLFQFRSLFFMGRDSRPIAIAFEVALDACDLEAFERFRDPI